MRATVHSTAQQLLNEFQLIEQAWKTAEEKIAETLVPIDVRVKVSSEVKEELAFEDQNLRRTETVFLGYVKAKGTRRICWTLETVYLDGTTASETKPIVECPVDTRIAMFDHYENLFIEAQAVGRSYVPKLREAREKFEKLLGKISPNTTIRKIVKLPNEEEA